MIVVLGLACGSDSGTPFERGQFTAKDFPKGDAALSGIAFDSGSGAPLMNLPVAITPSEGRPLEEELASPLQAEVRTDRQGAFTFTGIAPGEYVVFVRFDAHRLGYGEVVLRAQTLSTPGSIRIAAVPVSVTFLRPSENGLLASSDTVVVGFRTPNPDALLTLGPESRALYVAVDVYGPSGGGGSETGEGGPAAPRRFSAPLDSVALREGRARVPVDVGGLADPLRLQSFLGFRVDYLDPLGGPAGVHEIEGQTIFAASP